MDFPAADPRQNGSHLFSAQLVAGDVESPAEDRLAAVDQCGNEFTNVAYGDLL